MKWGDELPDGHDLSSLRLLGSVGEPINPEAWMWYRENIGGDRCPIVDTWWQTETGGIMITPAARASPPPSRARRCRPSRDQRRGGRQRRQPGRQRRGRLPGRSPSPWPAMLRGIWGDPERYQETYWSRFHGMYFAGDGAKNDEDGDLWLLGRVDDVMNISGHRISTTEVEHALVGHPSVAEAAVVGAQRRHDRSGDRRLRHAEGVPDDEAEGEAPVVEELREHVAKVIGPIAKPRQILLTPELPKTRSGRSCADCCATWPSTASWAT